MLKLVILISLLAGGCTEQRTPRQFDAAQALRDAEIQVAFGPRVPGTAGHRAMAAWLDSLLHHHADTVQVQRWEHTTRDGQVLPMVNFLAQLNPSAERRLLFVAHWDTRPHSDMARPELRDQPVPGANDGASGVAVLIGVLRALDSLPTTIGVDLLFVDGEDFGNFGDRPMADVLIGSQYYAKHQLAPTPLYAVVFDMVGDRDLRISREGNSMVGAPEVVDLVWEVASDLGHAKIFVPYAGVDLTDDHVPLQQAGIRAIDVIDFDYGPGRSWWHTPDDTIDKISAASLGVVGEVALGLVAREE